MADGPTQDQDLDRDLPALAERLCAAAGRARPLDWQPLAGGRNNRVDRLALADGTAAVLKRYFHHPSDSRDRLGAEWRFTSHAWGLGLRSVPEPLAADWDLKAGLYAFVPGERPRTEDIDSAHVLAAAAFVCAVNVGPPPDESTPPASEACFSLAEHLAVIDRRVERLGRLDPRAPYGDEAAALLSRDLIPQWQAVKAKVMADCRAAGIAIERALDAEETILSPSDFGFHNSLWDDSGQGVFLDFEYAGRDDVAKLVGDFLSCPEVPVAEAHRQTFMDAVAEGLAFDAEGRARIALLVPAYRVKWACIALNDFLPQQEIRRRFAGGRDRAERCAKQLEVARSLVA